MNKIICICLIILSLFICSCESLGIDDNSFRQGQVDNNSSDNSSNKSDSSNNNATKGEEMALQSAKNYLRYTAFSKKGLINQLEFEGYSNNEAMYAVNNCGADWKEQAVKKAQEYLRYTSFSKKGLMDQLEFEGFTKEEATYGVEQAYK